MAKSPFVIRSNEVEIPLIIDNHIEAPGKRDSEPHNLRGTVRGVPSAALSSGIGWGVRQAGTYMPGKGLEQFP